MSVASSILQVAPLLPPIRRPGGVPVLCYHRLVTRLEGPGEDRFTLAAGTLAAHLVLMSELGMSTVPVDQLGSTSASGAVLLTFDDNLVSHVTHALPVLTDARATAVFFLSPGDLGKAGQLSAAEVGLLVRKGMAIGAHGYHHVPAVSLDARTFAAEVAHCATFLRSYEMPLTWAYPGGHIGSFRPLHERILEDQGFKVRFSTLEGLFRKAALGVQCRYVIRRESSDRYVRAALRGGLQLVTIAKRLAALGSDLQTPAYIRRARS